MTILRRWLVVSLALAPACARSPMHMTVAAPAPPAPTEPTARGFGPRVQEGFERVRAATDRYHDIDSAVAAGYPREVARCLADGAHGAMGYHHVNRGLVDARLEVERPEILLFERRADGRYALNGVEYVVPYTVWPADSVPPQIMGLDLKREDNLHLWYLHMWAWRYNSAGLFADWNPDVSCPAGP